MKKSTKYKIEFLIVVSLLPILFGMIVFHEPLVNFIKLMVYAQLIPFNVVFAPGIDLQQYDGSVILNCLHGGGCPEGVTYVNDDTGEVEQRDIVPAKSTPVIDYSPESQGYVFVPESVQSSVANADMFAYVIYGLLIASVVVLIALLLKRRSKPV